ncbi:Putative BRCT domain, DNA-directed DNA polymerase X, DNA polymerase beta-like protein [Colletotrichum destructivum]|uniref:DNA polymerase n=1 Tax=Colletotrichum destructivum TaxID=34406 RepID=A0AAX4J282_9PEZI|nr:Putative BRCT domain, DNA-directed DNA polymerase X, DNA polymerase beta-like protein [Colletotrichum destructivum]
MKPAENRSGGLPRSSITTICATSHMTAVARMALELPPVYLLPTHLNPDELHDLEGKIPSLTYNIQEANIVIGKISQRERALFELRRAKVLTDPIDATRISESPSATPRKRKRALSGSGSESTLYSEDGEKYGPVPMQTIKALANKSDNTNTVKVVKLAWLTDSLAQGEILPLRNYLLYEGRKKGTSETPTTTKGNGILSRAATDDLWQTRNSAYLEERRRKYPADMHQTTPSLLRQTTSEHDSVLKLPPIPSFLGLTFACQRPTPVDPPNGIFVDELKKIRLNRKMVGDQIGVRAYSTSIATLSAYPYAIGTPQEVARLPGCGVKIAELWHEWKESGRLCEVDEAQADPRLSVIKTFYDIWGVGDITARDFYNRGWRDLDDVVEHGWHTLGRVQQIGVKYYDEFKLKIPRTEVESIADAILVHARNINPGFELVIVGGYRRGKQGSGDVDVVISHRDESATMHFVDKLVVSLEKSRHITHTLTLSNHNSERGQRPVSWKGNESRGSGFDTLDKALVVWQELEIESHKGYPKETKEKPHRRVDIIISPWKTVGCAVLGWSGDTTFQRDLRRYCKKQKSFKFDSSGIRSRVDGSWIDLEGGKLGKAPDMLTAEKRVFEGLDLEWVRPEDRCTG